MSARLRPWGGENHERHWGFLDCRGQKVLDIGAEYGSTADFFLRKGAESVVAVEYSQKYFATLRVWAQDHPSVVPIHQKIAVAEDLQNLIESYEIDIGKVDCEGCETCLVELRDPAFSSVREWAVELHEARWTRRDGNRYPWNGLEELSNCFLEKVERCGFEVGEDRPHGPHRIIHVVRRPRI